MATSLLEDRAGDDCFSASDLGLDIDSQAYREIVEELRSDAPWPVASVRAYFDRHWPGWDDLPTLKRSSPLTHLRGLDDAVCRGSEHSAEEGLRDLHAESGTIQLRLMCTKQESLQDECTFLLQVLVQVSGLWLTCRHERAHEREKAAAEALELRAAARSAIADATAAAREASQQQLEDLGAEVELHSRRADALEHDAAVALKQATYAAELKEHLEASRQEVLELRSVHTQALEDLREARAQRAFLTVAHEESEGAVSLLTRRLTSQCLGEVQDTTACEASTPSAPLQAAALGFDTVSAAAPSTTLGAGRGELFVRGARAALALADTAGAASALRPAVLAWRCALLEARGRRLEAAGAAASASGASVEREGRTTVAYIGCCCDGNGACCREAWLLAAAEALARQRGRLPAPLALASESASQRLSRSGGLAAALAALVALGVALVVEPRL